MRVIACLFFFSCQAADAGDWPQFAHDARRTSQSSPGPAGLSARVWNAGEHPAGTPIVFEGPSSPVVYNGRVYANARHIVNNTHVNNNLLAFDAATGEVIFQTLIDKSVGESWSTPAIDPVHGTVLLGNGSRLFAIDAVAGGVVWSTPLARPVVNASAAIYEDAVRGRALITDYTGFAAGGSLYCINTSVFDAVLNPFQPGDIVWSEPLGTTIGNTPAIVGDVVYVSAAIGNYPAYLDYMFAFNIFGEPVDRLRWSWHTDVLATDVFYSGVSYADGFLYAATYTFTGAGDTARMFKIDAATGSGVWTIPCNRTASTPVVDGNRIYLSTGIAGFGSVPRVQAFDDLGASAIKVWDTYADTGGSLIAGGWTHQPALADGILYVGKIPTSVNSFGPYTDLFMLDVALTPTHPDFVRAHRAGVGSSPAIANGRVFSLGTGGLQSIGIRGDLCGDDGRVNGRDVQCFVNAVLATTPTVSQIELSDFNDDNMISLEDAPGFIAVLLGV